MASVFPPKPTKVLKEKKPTSLRLPVDLAQALDAARKERDYSRTEAILFCIRRTLEVDFAMQEAEAKKKPKK